MLYELFSRIKVKYIFIVTILSILLYVFILFLQGGVLYIDSTHSKDVEVYIKSDTDESWRNEIIKANSWGLYYLQNGDYIIQTVDSTRENMVTRTISPFSFTKFSILQFTNQHDSRNLAFSAADCVKNNNPDVWYYFCNSSTENQNYISTTIDSINFNDIQSGTFTYPYKNGVIDILSNGDTSTIRYTAAINNQDSFDFKDSSITSIDEFATDTHNKNNSRFLILKNENLYIYSDFNKLHKRINIKKYINPSLLTSVKIIGDKIYILNTVDSNHLDEVGDIQHTISTNEKQKLFIFNTDGYLLKEKALPDDYSVEQWDIINNNLTSKGSYNKKTGIYKLENTDPERILPIDQITSWCVVDNNIYYIQQNNPNNFYIYRNSSDGSYLGYRNSNKSIATINCLYEKPYIALVDEGGSSDYNWIEVSNKPSSQNIESRDEEVFPMYDDSEDIEYAYIFKNTLYIQLKSVSGCNIDNYKKDKVLDYIKSQADINGLQPVFNNCL